jgi:hypothetical protein
VSHTSVRIYTAPDGRIKRVESQTGDLMLVSAVETHRSVDDPRGTVTLTFPRPHVEWVEEGDES